LRRLIRTRDRWYRRKKKSGNQRDAKDYVMVWYSWDNFGSPEASWIVGDYEVQNIWSSSWFLNNLT
jgi:aminoglycoside phosphotransferase (APT) family kinase protein